MAHSTIWSSLTLWCRLIHERTITHECTHAHAHTPTHTHAEGGHDDVIVSTPAGFQDGLRHRRLRGAGQPQRGQRGDVHRGVGRPEGRTRGRPAVVSTVVRGPLKAFLQAFKGSVAQVYEGKESSVKRAGFWNLKTPQNVLSLWFCAPVIDRLDGCSEPIPEEITNPNWSIMSRVWSEI